MKQIWIYLRYCLDLLRRVTSRAAMFWTRCRRAIWFWGRPVYNELHISKRHVLKEWTICSMAFWFRYFLILQILWKWNDAELTTFEIWDFMVIPASNKTPRLRTWLTHFYFWVDDLLCRKIYSTAWQIQSTCTQFYLHLTSESYHSSTD